MQFSENVSFLEPSATLALAARARELAAEGRSIADLSSGEPAYPTPDYASRAGIAAIEEGRTGYPPTQGIPELREAVSGYLTETTREGDPHPDQVLVSCGVKQALFNCVFSLFGSGDRVLIPSPYWTTYPALVRLAGAEPVTVETRWEDGFHLDLAALEARRTDRCRGLILNSPSNPTGAVYPRELLSELAAWAGRHGIWLLSDEIYRPLCWTARRAPSLLDVQGPRPRSVVLTGVSKAFCMPGWRIGCAVGPEELIRKASDLQSQTTSGAAGPSQYAAAEAFRNRERREAAVARLRERLAENRDAGIERLRSAPGLEVLEPEGAIYLYARLAGGGDSAQVTDELLVDAGVAAVPGEAFGSPDHLRFNFAVRPDTLEEGLDRTVSYFRERA